MFGSEELLFGVGVMDWHILYLEAWREEGRAIVVQIIILRVAAQVVNLVLFEAGDESTLMLSKDELGQETTNSEHRDDLDDVHLLC